MTGGELQALMERERLNAKSIADMLRVSGRTVYQWLNNSRAMSSTAEELLLLKLTLSSPENR